MESLGAFCLHPWSLNTTASNRTWSLPWGLPIQWRSQDDHHDGRANGSIVNFPLSDPRLNRQLLFCLGGSILPGTLALLNRWVAPTMGFILDGRFGYRGNGRHPCLTPSRPNFWWIVMSVLCNPATEQVHNGKEEAIIRRVLWRWWNKCTITMRLEGYYVLC
jgi:hypothetical protein